MVQAQTQDLNELDLVSEVPPPCCPCLEGKTHAFYYQKYVYDIYIDYSQNKFISGLTSAYMGLHYLLIICHYTRVL